MSVALHKLFFPMSSLIVEVWENGYWYWSINTTATGKYFAYRGRASANLVKKITLPSGSSAHAIPAGVFIFSLR